MKLIRHFLLLRSADLNVELDIVGLNLDLESCVCCVGTNAQPISVTALPLAV